MKRRLVVLVSGSGSNLGAILDACRGDKINAEVVLVVSNRPGVYALERAAVAGVPTVVHDSAVARSNGIDRRAYDAALAESVAQARPDYVVLAGWMRILTSAFLDSFPDRVVNLHPALPGEFPGAHAIDDAWQAHMTNGLLRTGVMVHLVPDERVDEGPVLGTAEVTIRVDDTLESLTQRIHETEHRLLIETLASLCN